MINMWCRNADDFEERNYKTGVIPDEVEGWRRLDTASVL